MAAQVWSFFRRRFGILHLNSQSISVECLSWFPSTSSVSANHIRAVIPCLILWSLWQARNKSRFEGARLEPQGVIWAVGSVVERLGRAKMFSSAHFKGVATWRPRATRRLVISWKLPPHGAVKLNTDASVTRGKVSGGGLLRDHESRLIFAFYKEFGEVDVQTAESLELLQGSLYCKRVRVQLLLVEVDLAGLVRLLESGGLAKWPLCNALRQIRSMLRSFNTTATHIFRKANAASDKLATMDTQGDFFSTTLQQLPKDVRATIFLDSRGIPFVRTQVVRE
nr:uncharacterized protein LOC113714069 [Coffea arabica]